MKAICFIGQFFLFPNPGKSPEYFFVYYLLYESGEKKLQLPKKEVWLVFLYLCNGTPGVLQ
jgi:hypothetical protein